MTYSRSREGAWIEIAAYNNQLSNVAVAPARERGLKSSRLVYDKWVNLSLPRWSVD